MSYNKYARFTFKTPKGHCFLMKKATIRKEYERWLAAELRRKKQARKASSTDFKITTTQHTIEERGRSRTRTIVILTPTSRSKSKSKLTSTPTPTPTPTPTSTLTPTPTKRYYDTRELKTKRKAVDAADSERPVKRVKTQHVAGILKVQPPSSAKDAKQVRWCASVQEPRVTVRVCPHLSLYTCKLADLWRLQAKIVRVSCPAPTPSTNSMPSRSLEFEDLSRTANHKKSMVERYTRSLVLPSWNHRHTVYLEMKKMDYGLDQWIETMAEKGSSTAQLLLAPRA